MYKLFKKTHTQIHTINNNNNINKLYLNKRKKEKTINLL